MQAGGGQQLTADQPAHVARFYDHDDELARSVGDHLGRALAGGAAVIVAATAGHRDAIEARMTAVGGGVTAARNDGRYLALDAAGTMSRFLVAGQIDPAAFQQVIGGAIRRAAAAGQPVHAFGEMVALLWDTGQTGAAIEVEALWNELAALVPFSLTCGYATASVSGDGRAGALETICGLHTAVTGHVPAGTRVRPGTGTVPGALFDAACAFSLSRSAPREARYFVARTLRRWGDSALTPDAEIIAGELAANAFVHARTGFTVTVSRTAGGVRIAVRDSSPVPEPGLVAAGGHGLGVVAVLSSRWAAEPLSGGKTVWADLAAPCWPAVRPSTS
jgi:hypothetical protein